MSSFQMLGKGTFTPEITHVSSHGVWLLTSDQELFMSYDEFPWFKEATLNKILKMQEVSPGHFYWPDLDVDLSLENIRHPGRFPLKAHSNQHAVHSCRAQL
ncbi:DUF2442 domain-containing protein [Candidatus Electronema sp. PJ]|uniref:DUF2442 domain-containing protein n=1 Tax=Candidatus Electronema sp. PJ TaxID=3401572 RepID=UPI003AA84BA8